MYCELKVNTVPVRMLINTGLAVSILSLLLYKGHLSHLSLRESTTTLRYFFKAVIMVYRIVETMV